MNTFVQAVYIYFFFLGDSYPDHTISDNFVKTSVKVQPGPRVVTWGYDFFSEAK